MSESTDADDLLDQFDRSIIAVRNLRALDKGKREKGLSKEGEDENRPPFEPG